MTQGSITKLTFLFALPLVLGAVLQQLYNTVDTVVVGNFCGPLSIAAVGTSAQPVEILLCLFLGIGHGVSILVSQAVGRKDTKEIKDISQTALSFLYLTAIPVTIIGFFLGPFILKLMMVPDSAFPLAKTYIQIILLGTLGQMGFNMNAGILRGLGDSKSSLFFLICSTIFNIILDLVFVALFSMNVFGAALATCLATYLSWILSILYIKRNYKELEFTFFPKKLDKAIFLRIIKIGLPLGMNSSLYSFGHTVIQGFTNTQGDIFMAGCVLASRLSGLAGITTTSFSSAALTFSGQNLGAKKYKRIHRGGIQIPLTSGAFTISMTLIALLLARPFYTIFTDDQSVINMALHYTSVVLPFNWCYSIFNGIINVANGLGRVKYSTVVNILMLWAVRIPSAWLLLTLGYGYYVMACIPISFVFGLLAMLFFY
ncbi:MAG: MATE family efflux transporter, partial [Treponema sp.]|nr:MATE family efflux transporter [Treponema sp.]